MLGEGPTDDTDGSLDTSMKNFSINVSKAKLKFCLRLHFNVEKDL